MYRDDQRWWLDVFGALTRATDVHALFGDAATIVRNLGFEYCSYGIRFPVSVTSPAVMVLDSYPANWMAHYTRKRYLLVDPTVHLGASKSGLIVWSDDLFAESPELWRDANDHGLRVGVAQSAWGTAGSYGLLSVARAAECISEAELSDLEPRLRWLGETIHQKMQSLLVTELVEECATTLSKREHDVLCWTADGKTSWEIAQILGISQSTVNFHVNSILVKLRSQNKLQAAVKAASLGMLGRRGAC
jgi:LuxR family quorum-sensing system transcriptional regulator SolR